MGKYLQAVNKLIFQKINIFKRKKKYNLLPMTIISSDCSGGCLLHDYGLLLDSPTVNLIIEGKDFIDFCNNIDFFLTLELEEDKTAESRYPVAYCGNIKIHGIHYHSFEDLKNTWNRRKQRIHKDNLVYLMTERQIVNEEDFDLFMQISGRKLFFSSVEFARNHKGAIGLGSFDSMFLFNGITGKRNIEKDFNFGEWCLSCKE